MHAQLVSILQIIVLVAVLLYRGIIKVLNRAISKTIPMSWIPFHFRYFYSHNSVFHGVLFSHKSFRQLAVLEFHIFLVKNVSGAMFSLTWCKTSKLITSSVLGICRSFLMVHILNASNCFMDLTFNNQVSWSYKRTG